MDITNLPPELQFEYLLKLTPQEILNYCQANKDAQSICEDPHFWERKSKVDFGLSFSILSEMTPYRKYRFMEMLSGVPAVLTGPVIRSGDQDLIDSFLGKLSSDEIGTSLELAIQADDFALVQHLAPLFFKQFPEEYEKYLKYAFLYDSIESIKYLVSLNPQYVDDLENLDELFEITPQRNRSYTLLVEHFKEMIRTYGKEQIFIIAEEENLGHLVELLKTL